MKTLELETKLVKALTCIYTVGAFLYASQSTLPRGIPGNLARFLSGMLWGVVVVICLYSGGVRV